LTDLDAFEQEVGSRPNAFVPKPYEIADLVRCIRDVLDAARKT